MKNASRLMTLAVVALAAAAAGPAPAQSGSRTIRCESTESREVSCHIPNGQVAEFVQQNSRAECVRGRTYWIEDDAIIVTRGCRATFRLFDAPYGTGDGLRSEMRSRLAVELGRMVRNDYRLSSSPSVTIDSDRDHPEGGGQIGYEGTARVERNGSYWNTLEFDATWDQRSRAFTRIDYEVADNAERDWDAGQRDGLERALADEVRRQKGGTVQVAVNLRHRSTRAGGDVTVTGKFGYSWNDGDWVTRNYEATWNPSRQQVRNVRILRAN